MTKAASFALQVAAGTAGTSHQTTSSEFDDFTVGQPLYLSFILNTVRSTGSQSENLRIQMVWYNSGGTVIAGNYFNDITVNGTLADTLKKYPYVPPAGAVKGACRIILTPAASPIQHTVMIKSLRLGKTELFATAGAQAGVNLLNPDGSLISSADNKLIGLGQNIIINSDFARVGNNLYGWSGAWGGNVANGVSSWSYNLVGSPTNWYGVNNVAFGVHTYNGTAGQGGYFDGHTHLPYSPGATIPIADLQRWCLPVAPGDRIFAGCLLAQHRCGAEAHITYYDANGTYLSEVGGGVMGFDGGATLGDPINFNRATCFSDVPSTARYARMNVRAQTIDGQTTPYIFYTQMMLCKIAPGQTVAPPYSPGPISEHGAEANRWIVGPPQSTVFNYDYTGAAQADEFPRTMTFTLVNSAGPITSGVTWQNRIVTGVYNGVGNGVGAGPGPYNMTVTNGVGSLSVVSMGSDIVTVEVTATYNGMKYTQQFQMTRKIAAAPTSNGGSGGTGSTTVATKSSGYSTFSSTAFVDISGPITGNMPSGVTVANVSLQINITPTSQASSGGWTIELKAMRDISGSPTLVGALQTASSYWNATDVAADAASFTYSFSDTGVPQGASATWRIYARVSVGGSKTHKSSGQVVITA